MNAVKSFQLPDLGEGLTEAELTTWCVAVGDTVELNQIIAEVETAKAAVELPSPYAGRVTELHAAEGATIEVGTTIIDIDTGSLTGAPADPDTPVAQTTPRDTGTTPEPATGERIPVLVGYGAAGEASSRRRRRTALPSAHKDAPAAPEAADSRPAAKPPVRFYASQHGVDLTRVTPTGARGDITREDIDRHLAAASGPAVTVNPAASGSPGDRDRIAPDRTETRTPVKGVRKHTAAAMVESAFTAPHVTEFITIDVTPTVELIERLRQSRHFADVRLTPLALVAKALLIALRANPSLNSSWDEANQEIITKHYVNLGIAAATPRGLMVPNIKDAHMLGLRDLAAALKDLTGVAKEGKTPPEDLARGTITITNVGVFGVDAGTPILNPGEAAILCFGAIRRQPWEHQNEIALRSVTTLSLSFDHRLVDGEQGSRFLADIARLLADPLDFIALG
jgi:pyruvate dehydrogenase E2 component (dihydrolipoamide acetyltransferase)